MRPLWMLVLLLTPLALAAGGTGDVPAQQGPPRKQEAKKDAPLKKPTGDLYFVAIGQQDDWKFLPDGFERAMHQAKGLYCEVHGRVLIGPKATKKELMDGLDWIVENARADDLVMVFIVATGIASAGRAAKACSRPETARCVRVRSK